MRDPAKARDVIVYTAGERGPRLTEYAWEWILKEEDPTVLGLLLDLFSCELRRRDARRLLPVRRGGGLR